MSHSGKFMCTMCGKRFDTKEEVREHAKKTHDLDLDVKAVKYFYRKC